jgi:hypothetical protein
MNQQALHVLLIRLCPDGMSAKSPVLWEGRFLLRGESLSRGGTA